VPLHLDSLTDITGIDVLVYIYTKGILIEFAFQQFYGSVASKVAREGIIIVSLYEFQAESPVSGDVADISPFEEPVPLLLRFFVSIASPVRRRLIEP